MKRRCLILIFNQRYLKAFYPDLLNNRRKTKMKKSRSLLYLIFAFVFAQFAWMGLLGLWIYWYVSNYLILEQVGDKLSPQIIIDSPNVFIFVGGIILIVGIAVAMFFIFRNLTVQLKLTRLYDNFIANITHELKSPLSSIQLYLETLQSKNVPQEKQREFIAMMMKDSNRLHKLINTILEISRLEQKKISHDYRVYNADEIFRELVLNSAEHFKVDKSAISFAGNSNCECVIDKNAMQIVFDNLTDNAIKYSVTQVSINVAISKIKKKFRVSFSDKGIGVSSRDQKKIFNKFHRVQSKTIPNVKGTGLGLYWVKSIVKQHGGIVYAESVGTNKGMNVVIELPVYKESKKRFINSLLKRGLRKENLTENKNGK